MTEALAMSLPLGAVQAAANTAQSLGKPEMGTDALHQLVMTQLDDDQAQDIVSIPLEGKSSIADHMVIIHIVDNGAGFPSLDRKRLLEPYMTTRAKGTGLGLAIVSRAFEEHGGRLELADRQDGQRGARVLLSLPIMALGQLTASEKENKTSMENINGG
ncbi:MAG: hypothetical protein HC777_00675 [Hyphomonadaceae bacterium]|nr:hypothetical protein [Hyphomonadaceae bacterium]